MDRIVLCLKWSSLLSSEYVNVLYNAGRSNMTSDFRFVCLTDDDSGFVGGIESFPIPDIGCNHTNVASWGLAQVGRVSGGPSWSDGQGAVCGP